MGKTWPCSSTHQACTSLNNTLQCNLTCSAKAHTDTLPRAKRVEVSGCAGTTSKPKGVPLTHANLAASLANIRDTYELKPTDRSLLVMPLFHVHGLMAGAAPCHTSSANDPCISLHRPAHTIKLIMST